MQSLAACITWWEGMEMLEIFAYRTVAVVHFTDQNWISKTMYFIKCVMVCKLVLPTETQKSDFCVRPWSLLTILNFSDGGRQTQRYFNFSSCSRRDNYSKISLRNHKVMQPCPLLPRTRIKSIRTKIVTI